MYKNANQHPNTVRRDIKFDIEFKIITSEFKAGDQIPPQRELMKIYNISPTTAYKILEELFKDGTVIKKPNVGFFVKPYVATKLKEKHINYLKGEVEQFITHAKNINADYNELNPILALLNNYIDTLSSR